MCVVPFCLLGEENRETFILFSVVPLPNPVIDIWLVFSEHLLNEGSNDVHSVRSHCECVWVCAVRAEFVSAAVQSDFCGRRIHSTFDLSQKTGKL